MVEQLRGHAVAGRLDADELATRAEEAYKARTLGELAPVLCHLPGGRAPRLSRDARRRSARHLPALGVVGAAGATVVVAMIDGGFRGPFDGVAAVPFWATLASGGALAARILSARPHSREFAFRNRKTT